MYLLSRFVYVRAYSTDERDAYVIRLPVSFPYRPSTRDIFLRSDRSSSPPTHPPRTPVTVKTDVTDGPYDFFPKRAPPPITATAIGELDSVMDGRARDRDILARRKVSRNRRTRRGRGRAIFFLSYRYRIFLLREGGEDTSRNESIVHIYICIHVITIRSLIFIRIA